MRLSQRMREKLAIDYVCASYNEKLKTLVQQEISIANRIYETCISPSVISLMHGCPEKLFAWRDTIYLNIRPEHSGQRILEWPAMKLGNKRPIPFCYLGPSHNQPGFFLPHDHPLTELVLDLQAEHRELLFNRNLDLEGVTKKLNGLSTTQQAIDALPGIEVQIEKYKEQKAHA